MGFVEIPYGDPGAMRGLASRLRSRVDSLEHVSSVLRDEPYRIEFQCPAADLFRSHVSMRVSQLDFVIGRLNGLALYLDQQADLLESQQTGARAHNRAYEDELERQKQKSR